MNIKCILITITVLLTSQLAIAQKQKTDANIIGHVVDEKGTHIPFASVSIKGTTIGTTTDESGHYQLINLPEGTWTVKAQSLGYQPEEVEIFIAIGETKEIKFDLRSDVLGLEEVVVTGNRNETYRKESSVIVNTITPKTFAATQSITLSDGLNFVPGARIETNCQNCGFPQLRMNGMEGPYSQILINNRPIFSGLAGVYGLELIPANMIERVEVVRGGGSALYGSNAIAGTINLILKDPINNSYEAGVSSGLVGVGMDGSGGAANEYNVHFNTSLVSADNKTGAAIYGFRRNRQPFDANRDGFSELGLVNNTTIGSRLYHRFGTKSKVMVDFFNIREERRGGNKFDEPKHIADIAEAVEHDITTGAITFEQHLRKKDVFSAYVSMQHINRDSYYGAEQSLQDYGHSKNLTYVAGVQYSAFFGNSGVVVGLEHKGESLLDEKLGYPILDSSAINFEDSSLQISYADKRTIANQISNTAGIFAEYELHFGQFDLTAGLRYDNYTIRYQEHEQEDKSGSVLSPRFTLKYDVLAYLQARISYAQGYRAPQIFDEDLHIETSGARRVVHRNAPDLKRETSHSYMASLDFNKKLGNTYLGILMEGFYTHLLDAFSNEIGEPSADGTVIYTRVNAENGALVRGVNLEVNAVPSETISLKGGFTFQKSTYEKPQEFNEKSFLRTPNDYGYISLIWEPKENFGASASGTYTGKMLVPYFGPQLPDPENGELRESPVFFDAGIKVYYNIRLNGAKLQLYTGVKNIFNSYQDDFDSGIDRDPGYIYGPVAPRMIYGGIKIGNVY